MLKSNGFEAYRMSCIPMWCTIPEADPCSSSTPLVILVDKDLHHCILSLNVEHTYKMKHL